MKRLVLAGAVLCFSMSAVPDTAHAGRCGLLPRFRQRAVQRKCCPKYTCEPAAAEAPKAASIQGIQSQIDDLEQKLQELKAKVDAKHP